jgi:glycosyltransferase involved in cell wall biosynthesis
MYLRCAGDKPSLITLHDLLHVFAAAGKYPGLHVRFTGRIQSRWIAAGLKQARNIVSVSQKTDCDLLELAPEIRANRWVIYHTLNWDFYPVPRQETEAALAAGRLPKDLKYILHVGSNGRLKNRTGVVRIFRELKNSSWFANVSLVMAGKDGIAGLRKLLAELDLTDAVFPIHPTDDGLRALYSGALALVFPSLEEGFGWPILEAQACGCPVITSNRAPMTEVAGSGAIFINPEDAGEAARKILEAWPIPDRMRETGFRNLSRFGEAAVFDAYCKVYERVVADSHNESA